MITLRIRIRPVLWCLSAVALLMMLLLPAAGYTQGDIRYFPETHHTVRGQFLQYWTDHGGLAQQGYPLTEEFQEKNQLNGQTYTVQYFERAVFEKHPENNPPFDVLLSQLGKFSLEGRYPNNSNPAAAPVTDPGGGGAAPTATTAPPAGESVTRSGHGIQKTDPFHLSGGNYKIGWTAKDTAGSGCYHGGFLRAVDGSEFETVANEILGKNESKSGSTNAFGLKATDYYLDMSSGCDWTVTITKQ